jgi:hypothetical protein
MYHTCMFAGLAIYGHSDHETDITIEFTLKNGSWRCITLVCLLDLPYMVLWSRNRHYHWIHIEKWFLKMYHTCVFAGLPYMVTLITKPTSPLNSHRKMVPENVSHLCVCWTCHIWSCWSRNRHHHWIHVKKWFPKMYHTCGFARLAIYGHSDHETDITIEFTSKNGSRRCITLVCLPDLPYMVTTVMKWTNRHYHWKPL